MKDVVIAAAGPDLAARGAGANLRREIERAVVAGEQVVVDLKEVQSISDSFADEAFGILALEFGQPVLGKISFDVTDRYLLAPIAKAIRARLLQSQRRPQPNRAGVRR
jgi:hypothetical protein